MGIGNKFNARKIYYSGKVFDSKKEFERYLILDDMQKHGEIEDLQTQVQFILIDKQKHDGKVIRAVVYIADFTYYKDGNPVVEDVKGYKGGAAYQLFKIKKKLMLERYGLWVEEI